MLSSALSNTTNAMFSTCGSQWSFTLEDAISAPEMKRNDGSPRSRYRFIHRHIKGRYLSWEQCDRSLLLWLSSLSHSSHLEQLGEIYERFYRDWPKAFSYYESAFKLDGERADAWFYAGTKNAFTLVMLQSLVLIICH